MKLRDFSLGRLFEALRTYEAIAYRGEHCPSLPSLPESTSQDASLECILDRFLDETPQQEGNAHRYVLRLGNLSYPFMKFVLEEHLIRGEYFLAVDTHDQMFHATEDDAQLEELRRHNAEIKQAIEERWAEQGLPTTSHLKGLVETRPLPPLPPRHQTILLVDDDRVAADTLRFLLEARGFEVDYVENGAEMLGRAAPGTHDLVLMDVEMPVMDGLEACRRLKGDRTRSGLPVLLATAGAIDLRRTREADAFLTKPFQAEILFSFIDHLLPPPRDWPGGGGVRAS